MDKRIQIKKKRFKKEMVIGSDCFPNGKMYDYPMLKQSSLIPCGRGALKKYTNLTKTKVKSWNQLKVKRFMI